MTFLMHSPLRRLVTLGAGLFLLSSAALAAGSYTRVLPEKSSLVFVSSQMGVSVDGSFKRFSATVNFDPAMPEAGRATLDIDLASIDAGGSEANEEVKGKNWFDVKQHPTARFVSTSVKPLGNNRYEVRGNMSIRGQTREVAAPFTLKTDGAGAVLEGSFPLKRLDYGIGSGVWGDTDVVANEVRISFRLAVAGQ
ncbi:MAG: YceI family protein [Gammaproteobacteria bacterium]|jgi:polyisoprenoid-binding protein YceI|nr:YceI family protein [Gammaproteobacteria bacterium]MBU0772266.1 YceI family protein [Gammaproteobacteria bacterium]MBU0857877.1 YceI family protein [Gammaproteobacteria bacterium]MBU1848393.1 YceI family protein [Gammaproteobacteria bacterium]